MLKPGAGDKPSFYTPALRAVSGPLSKNSGDFRAHSSLLRQLPGAPSGTSPGSPAPALGCWPCERGEGRRGQLWGLPQDWAGHVRGTENRDLRARLCPASRRSRSSHGEP